jgi:hypothetical protein
MLRLTALAFATLLVIDSLAAASDVCCPPEPRDVCLKSHDYRYHVGDRVTSYMHWSATENPRILSCATKAPHLRCTSITTTHKKEVKLRDCKPTIVTREYASVATCLEPRDVPIEAAFREYRCCTDCCCRCYVCTCLGPIVCVDEPDFCPRAVTTIIARSAKTIECCEVKKVCEFKRVTTKCDTEDVEVVASTVGEEHTWTADACSLPTGLVRLDTKPAVHFVPVACVNCLPCSLPCVGCKYTPCHSHREAEQRPNAPTSAPSNSTLTPPASANQTPAKSSKTPAAR